MNSMWMQTLILVLTVVVAGQSSGNIFEDLKSSACDQTRKEIIEQFKKLTNKELQDRLQSIVENRKFRYEPEYDICLSEIVRRGGMQWQTILSDELDDLNSTTFKFGTDIVHESPGGLSNLELTTALRRTQKEKDPLQIEIGSFGKTKLTPVILPKINVTIKNIDANEVGFTVGGNYRSGRQTRWRVELIDEEGKTMPQKPFRLGIGGGLSTQKMLKPGDSWETELILDQMVEVHKPGKYKLQVSYHDVQSILFEKDVDGLIVSKSEPIEFELHPINIRPTADETKQITSLIQQLGDSQKVKLLVGEYGKWAHDFIEPDSPQAKLLQFKFKSIPLLVKAANDSGTSEIKRAQLFAILFSITGHHDPRLLKVIDGYRYLIDGWGMKNSVQVQQHSGTASGPGIDEIAQKQLAESWMAWVKDMISDQSAE